MNRLVVYIVLIITLFGSACSKKESSTTTTQEQSSKTSATATSTTSLLEDPVFSDNGTFAVVTGDGVRSRTAPELNASVQYKFYKGNIVYISKETEGADYKGNKIWYAIHSRYTYSEGFIHSTFVVKGDEANTYLASLNFDDFRTLLKSMFSNEQIHQLKTLYDSYKKIKTAADFASYWELLNKVQASLSDTIGKEYEKNPETPLDIAWIHTIAPQLTVQYVAEGTNAIFKKSYRSLFAKAQQTEGNEDEDFIRFLMTSYGKDESFWGNWFMPTWDYGGRSLLGKGLHLKLLKESDRLLAISTTYKSDLDNVRQQLFNDITMSIAYEHSFSDIEQEVQAIIQEVHLSSEEKAALTNRLSQFKNPPADQTIQFECSKNNCNEGG